MSFVGKRVGDFTLVWGESLRWDDRRQRLYFVDCVQRTLHWLEGGTGPLQTMKLPGLPTGVVLTTGAELVVCFDQGLHVVHPDRDEPHKCSSALTSRPFSLARARAITACSRTTGARPLRASRA